MNSVVRVEIPQSHVVMATVLHISVTGKRYKCNVKLAVYENSMADANVVWKCQKKPVPRRLLSPGANLYVHFQSDNSRDNGFRLFFSVTRVSATLHHVKPALDLWNCSVANFVDFKPHFPCDLYPQCLNKEDERDCPYFSEECGLGFVSLANYCLVYANVTTAGTWRDREFLCQQRGMRLANFRRREDLKTLMRYLEPLKDIWSFSGIAVGIHSVSLALPMMYRFEMQNSDGTVAFYRSIQKVTNVEIVCGMIVKHLEVIRTRFCTERRGGIDALCEIPKTSTGWNEFSLKISPQPTSNHTHSPPLIGCPPLHFTRDFLVCDAQSMCWSHDKVSCPAPLKPLPPSFACTSGVERVPYTLVCDIRPDCTDGSDENFCVFPPCDLPEPFYCSSHECVSFSTVCNGQQNCYNGFDEDLCSKDTRVLSDRPAPPGIVRLNRHGQFNVNKMTQSELADLSPGRVCPETHFQCHDDGYCMPIFLRCNDVYDCPGKEDERSCNTYMCPGYYRCRGTRVCLHTEHLCDGIFQCPQNDDELLCELNCPVNCKCYGLAFYCQQPFRVRNISKLRFLDARGSGVRISDLMENSMLSYLSLAENGMTTVRDFNFPNLHSLDLSDNCLKEIRFHELTGLPQLKTLYLSGNPLLSIFQYTGIPERLNNKLNSENAHHTAFDVSAKTTFMLSLRRLDLSRIKVEVLNTSFLSLLSNLHTVNISGCGVDTLLGKGFRALTQLRVLDLRGCPLTYFPRDVLRGLEQLERVHSDNYKLCCPAALPAGFVFKNCHAPSDELSSCTALLGSSYYRIFVSVLACLALLGNSSSLVYRVVLEKKRLLGYEVFLTHLRVANLLMGVYLSVIGVADVLYQGTYLWEDNTWKSSAVCQVAGFLYLMSSEVSAIFVCLITIDRFLVIRFPFSTFHFGTRSALVASLCAWTVGCLIASAPLASRVSTLQFYGRTGACVPLPDDVSDFPVAFKEILGATIACFSVTIIGQVFICWSVHTKCSSLIDTTAKSHDLIIARRFITVAMFDFLCWFLVVSVGLFAASGAPFSGDVNVALAIFVLPSNSAINPFLYSFNIVLENVRRADEERIKKRITAQFSVRPRIFK